MKCIFYYFFFFFSSRRRHTRSDRDWSSDVCSSDLGFEPHGHGELGDHHPEEGEHEHDGQEGETALISHGPVTGRGTMRGGCSTLCPRRITVSVTSTAAGSVFSVAASQRSVHTRSEARR